MAIMEWLTAAQVLFYMSSHFTMYYQINLYVSTMIFVLFAIPGFIALPIVTEEIIKICSIVGPDRIIFATGLLQTASYISTGI